MGSLPETLLNGNQPSSSPHNPSSRYSAKYFPKQEPWNPQRPVKIIIVGGGIAGLAAGVLLPKKVPNSTVTIYERQRRVGGTWSQNVYPGVRCDVPSHAYQLTVDPKTDWTEYYPKGSEIQQYYEDVVDRNNLRDSLRVNHEVLSATWLKHANQWALEIKDLKTGNVFIDTADFFVSAQGRIADPKYPKIKGLLDTFGGRVVHTAAWPPDLDISGKRVAVIGNGASGQQIVPNIFSLVSHLDHYVRTKTWVTASFSANLHQATADAPGGPVYTDEQKEIFRTDSKAHLEHRREFFLALQRPPGSEVLGSKANAELRGRIIETMRSRVGGDEEWLQRLLPDYAPGCKRLTPAPGYLETLQEEKAEFITEGILEVDKTGIRTVDGTHREVDVIITATGFERVYTSRFPIIGRDGVDLREKFSLNGKIGYPETYLGLMAPGCPNYFTVLQAQGNARGGSVPLQCEIASTYIAKCIRKVQSQSNVWLEPRQDAAEEFNDVVNGWAQDKVFQDSCDAWSKIGYGATRTLLTWPGTYHHRSAALRDPRWEDFHFKRRTGAEKNRFEYFGTGITWREVHGRSDELLTSYLKEVGKFDLATVHELWND
ncbi:hypothetical protein BJY04DRAFT_230965 [Aspergillus karnatakaensis]|uniref:flavin-containing monooxygenase n=1 Tax=Aspergillus karnatakaensis TaxID=1810916 RepID=UPI003CCCC3A0